MKKILSAAVAIIIALSFCFIPANAETMPYWYPQNTADFKDFHGENLPRVVDDAGILSDAEEAELSAEIQEIVDTYEIGYVIFTDNDNHGLSQEYYSSDFLHFNGYGVGDDYSAVVFYLSLEEGNRGWRTTSINGCEKIFNSRVTYTIDELVDSDIRNDHNYFAAFKKHVAFVKKLMSDLTDLPDWYPEGEKFYERYAEVDLPKNPVLSKARVTDNGDYFSDEQEAIYTKKLNELSEKYDYDLIIFTDSKCHSTYASHYADDFYNYNGYGENGMVFYIIKNNYDKGDYYYYGYVEFGKFYDKYTDLNILNNISDSEDEDAYQKAAAFIDTLEYMLANGKLPQTPEEQAQSRRNILYAVAVGLVLGLIIGAIVLASLKKRMRVSNPISARVYLVPGSFMLRDKSVDYLYTTVTKVAKPKDSGGGGGGGGSSFSSGSSAGGSFSSGGRNF